MAANEENKPRSDLMLVQEAFSCASQEQLQQWVVEHHAEIGEGFFMAIAALQRVVQSSGDTERARYIQDVTEFIRLGKQEVEEIDADGELLLELFAAETRAELLACLHSNLLKITPRFFTLLAQWAGDRNREGDTGIALCEALLDLIEFNDLREDWNNTERTIIWGSVRFMHRNTPFGSFLTHEDDGLRPLLYDALRDTVVAAVNLAQHADMSAMGLAMLNVVLELSPRAVQVPLGMSRAGVLRVETLVMGAKIIMLRGGRDFVNKARRRLSEALALSSGLDDHLDNLDNQTAFASNKIAILDMLGELALLAHQPGEAVRLHQQALEQHAALISVAAGRDLSPRRMRSVELGLPNSLAYLAQAEIRTWQLDAAAMHIEQAIAEYRRLVIPGYDLAEHFRTQARIEFLRTNFERAEALLNEAKRLQQVEQAKGVLRPSHAS